jgi:hypothetical protein
MAIDIDGFAVLRSIAAHPSAFREVASEVAKAARKLVIAQIKNKSTDLKMLRQISRALGADTFNLVAEGMSDAQIKTLITRIDKNHPQLKTSNPRWRRQHLSALVDGSIEPAAKTKAPQRSAKKSRVKEAGVSEILNFRSAGLTWKR